MGCGPSKPKPNPAAELRKAIADAGPLPEVRWVDDPEWAPFLNPVFEEATRTMRPRELYKNFGALVNTVAEFYIRKRYPECAAAGSIEQLEECTMPFGPDSKPQVPTKAFLVLDEGFNGVVYASTVVVNSPLAWKALADAKNPELPGSVLKSPDMENAKMHILFHMATIQKQGVNVKHCNLSVIIGPVKVNCFFDMNVSCTPVVISVNKGRELPELTHQPEQKSDAPIASAQPLFRPRMFMSVLKTLEEAYPGCAIWDLGEMEFDAHGTPYPHPMRLLACRDFTARDKSVETVDFQVTGPGADGKKQVSTILRSKTTGEEPGGTVCYAAVITVDPEVDWPKRDAKKYMPIVTAVSAQLSKYMMLQAFLAEFERCGMRVWVGQQVVHTTFVAGTVIGSPEDVASYSNRVMGGRLPPLKTSENVEDGTDIEKVFGVSLKRQQEHTRWESESQFQFMRQAIMERAETNPERYAEIAIMGAHKAAQMFLERNFPGCIVSDKGELPQPEEESGVPKFEHTKVWVARDKNQEPSSIVAVVAVVPSPAPGYIRILDKTNKTWLDTPESTRADDCLLTLLKMWHSEGKTSKVDCYAEVMIGVDATIYQFVDGDKFIDYSEERMGEMIRF